jgi:thiosulfate dehydrogenase (quinone) large subunit
MMFLFAYIGSQTGASHDDWPLRLIYATEGAFIALSILCIFLAARLRRSGPTPWHPLIAIVGGVCVGFGLIMPFELAPMFFGVRGEWMMATMLLIMLYPFAAALFISLFWKFMNRTPESASS